MCPRTGQDLSEPVRGVLLPFFLYLVDKVLGTGQKNSLKFYLIHVVSFLARLLGTDLRRTGQLRGFARKGRDAVGSTYNLKDLIFFKLL